MSIPDDSLSLSLSLKSRQYKFEDNFLTIFWLAALFCGIFSWISVFWVVFCAGILMVGRGRGLRCVFRKWQSGTFSQQWPNTSKMATWKHVSRRPFHHSCLSEQPLMQDVQMRAVSTRKPFNAYIVGVRPPNGNTRRNKFIKKPSSFRTFQSFWPHSCMNIWCKCLDLPCQTAEGTQSTPQQVQCVDDFQVLTLTLVAQPFKQWIMRKA